MNLTTIHQIEITSRCNLRCSYCVHPTMPRAKQDMDEVTYKKALGWAHRLHYENGRRGTELNLCGIGESTLHPRFLDYMGWARSLMPAEVNIILATNGLPATESKHGWTEELAAKVSDLGNVSTKDTGRILIWVSLHRPEKAGPTVELLRRYNLLAGVSADPSISSVNWAGQVNYHVSAQRTPCPWLMWGWGMVLADGRVTQCCFDGQGTDGVLGTIWDDVSQFQVRPYSLCPSCHHEVPSTMKGEVL